MKTNSIRLLALIFCIVFVVGISSGCGQSSKNNTETTQSTQQQTEATETTSKSSGKISEKPLTLSIWVAADPKVTATMKSYSEILQYKEMEKITGITIEWIHPSYTQQSEVFNLVVASGDLPDMIYYNWPTVPGGPAKYIDETIIKLNPLMDEHAPNIMQIYKENPDWYKDAIMDDGTQYYIPYIRQDKFVAIAGGLQIRKDWLDYLGLKVPTTLNEYYDVMVAFRDGDPNKNGQKDEIPLVFTNTYVTSPQDLLTAFGLRSLFYYEDGVVKAGPLQPAYKDYVETLARWYREGLINQDYLTTDIAKMDQMVTSNIAGSWYGMFMGTMGRYLDLMKPNDPNVSIAAVPYFKAPNGKASNWWVASIGPQSTGMAITTGCKHPVEALRWLDYHYSPEGQLLNSFGIEGVSYEMVDGKPKYLDHIINDPNGLPVTNSVARYTSTTYVFMGLFRSDAWRQVLNHPELGEALDTWGNSYDISTALPKISFTADESKEITSIINDATKYVDEITNKVIMGMEPISKIDEMVESLKKMGLERVVEIHQAAVDRYNARK